MLRTRQRIACALLIAALPLGAHAQEPANPESNPVGAPPEVQPWETVRVGLKAGATWSTLRGEFVFPDLGTVPFTGDFGFAVGISVEIPIGRKLSVQPAAFLVRKFSQLDLGGQAGLGRQKLSVNYLEFPVLLKWYPGNRAGVQGNLVVGPMPSLRTASTREIRVGDSVTDVDATELVNEVDWAVVVGGGFEFDELLGAFTVDLRYSHGLRDISAVGGGTKGRWSVLQMVLGITL